MESDRKVNPQLENNFKYHTPKADQPEKYNKIREKAKELAYLIDCVCPNGREKSLAMTKLEEASMWANTSIARDTSKLPNTVPEKCKAVYGQDLDSCSTQENEGCMRCSIYKGEVEV